MHIQRNKDKVPERAHDIRNTSKSIPEFKETLHILFGSRTGNAESAAKLASRYATYLGIRNILLDMKNLSLEQFAGFRNVLLAVSTHGEGDPPAAAAAFYNAILGDRAPDLSMLSFGILALGDSSYKDFCKTGNDFRERFLALNAREMCPIAECDIDYEERASAWAKDAVDAFAGLLPANFERQEKVFSFQINKRESERENVYYAKVLQKKWITHSKAEKKVMHLVLSLDNFHHPYSPGDTFGVFVNNSRLLTDKLIKQLNFDRSFVVKRNGGIKLLKDALLTDYEITQLTPAVLRKYVLLTGNDALKRLLSEQKAVEEYCRTRDVIDLVSDFPGVLLPDAFLSLLRKLTPRHYSVASSPLMYPGELHLTVSLIDYPFNKRVHKGVCSGYLSDRIEIGDTVPIALERNESFRLTEDDSVPLIMIGTSTGIAPFRAFLQEREYRAATGENWLFFGDRHRESDFLYEEEIQTYVESGLLSRLNTAFSRDGDQKEYVQHHMLKHSKALFEWMDKRNAVVYLCGSKRTVGKGVKDCLEKIIAMEGRLSHSAARTYLQRMKTERRFQSDIY
jgi:sulfite reductase (NADPH) flavoprotein alpha-component